MKSLFLGESIVKKTLKLSIIGTLFLYFILTSLNDISYPLSTLFIISFTVVLLGLKRMKYLAIGVILLIVGVVLFSEFNYNLIETFGAISRLLFSAIVSTLILLQFMKHKGKSLSKVLKLKL